MSKNDLVGTNALNIHVQNPAGFEIEQGHLLLCDSC